MHERGKTNSCQLLRRHLNPASRWFTVVVAVVVDGFDKQPEAMPLSPDDNRSHRQLTNKLPIIIIILLIILVVVAAVSGLGD